MADENYALPRVLTEEERKDSNQDNDNDVDGKSFVVMGAITECDQGFTKKPVLRTVDIGSLDGYGIKMFNIDTDDINNWADEGVKINLSGENAGKSADPSIDITPTIWYEKCASRRAPGGEGGGKCIPDFIDEWFEPSETVGYQNNNLAVNEYQKALEEARDTIDSLEKDYSNFVQEKVDGWWFGLGNLVHSGKKKNRDKIDEKNVSAINPKISSRIDAKNDLDTCTSALEIIQSDAEFSKENSEKITQAETTIKNTEDRLTALTSDKTDKYFPLLKRSVLICKRGGVVRITNNGQILSMIEYLNKLLESGEYDKIKEIVKDLPFNQIVFVMSKASSELQNQILQNLDPNKFTSEQIAEIQFQTWAGRVPDYDKEKQEGRPLDFLTKFKTLEWDQEKINKVWEKCEKYYKDTGVLIDPWLFLSVIKIEGTGSFNTSSTNLAGDGQNGVETDFDIDLDKAFRLLSGKVVGYAVYGENFRNAFFGNNDGKYPAITGAGNIYQYMNWQTPYIRPNADGTGYDAGVGVYAGAVTWGGQVETFYGKMSSQTEKEWFEAYVDSLTETDVQNVIPPNTDSNKYTFDAQDQIASLETSPDDRYSIIAR